MEIQTLTRRKILSTAATLAVGTPLLKRTSFAAVKAITPEPVNPLLQMAGDQLTYVLAQLKAGTENPRDTSEAVGLLSALFASWLQDGTEVKLQSHLTPEYVSNFRVTDKLKSDLAMHAATVNRSGTSILKFEDLRSLDALDYSQLPSDVETNLRNMVVNLRTMATDQQAMAVRSTLFRPVGWIPLDQYCRTVANLTAAAGLTAAIATFFAPPIAGVFGILAGIGAAASTLNGC